MCVFKYQVLKLCIYVGLFLVKGFEYQKWVNIDPMLFRLRISNSSPIFLADDGPGNRQPKDKHYRNHNLIRSAIRGRHSFQYTSPLLSELPVGLPLAKAASPFLIWGKRAPQEDHRAPPSADTKEKTLSQKQKNPTSRIPRIRTLCIVKFLNFLIVPVLRCP